jgi:hypothetical protein
VDAHVPGDEAEEDADAVAGDDVAGRGGRAADEAVDADLREADAVADGEGAGDVGADVVALHEAEAADADAARVAGDDVARARLSPAEDDVTAAADGGLLRADLGVEETGAARGVGADEVAADDGAAVARDDVLALAGDDVAGGLARRDGQPAEEVVRPGVDDAEVEVGDGAVAGGVRADVVALDGVVVGAGRELDAGAAVAGDDVAGRDGRAADEVVVGVVDEDAVAPVGERGVAGRVRADEVAGDDVAVAVLDPQPVVEEAVDDEAAHGARPGRDDEAVGVERVAAREDDEGPAGEAGLRRAVDGGGAVDGRERGGGRDGQGRAGRSKLMVSAPGVALACWMAARSVQLFEASRQRPSAVSASAPSAFELTTKTAAALAVGRSSPRSGAGNAAAAVSRRASASRRRAPRLRAV